MWHTASYNRYSGDFIIAGGATKQSNDDSIDDEPLSEHILQFRGKFNKYNQSSKITESKGHFKCQNSNVKIRMSQLNVKFK